jgi:hypothetical protein
MNFQNVQQSLKRKNEEINKLQLTISQLYKEKEEDRDRIEYRKLFGKEPRIKTYS